MARVCYFFIIISYLVVGGLQNSLGNLSQHRAYEFGAIVSFLESAFNQKWGCQAVGDKTGVTITRERVRVIRPHFRFSMGKRLAPRHAIRAAELSNEIKFILSRG